MDPVLDLASGYRVQIAHFFLKSVTVELSKCTIPSGECIEGSLADALLRDPHYLSRRKHQATGGKHGKFRLPACFP
jgi:hypothetical protein